MEIFKNNFLLENFDINIKFCQDNLVYSKKMVLRGMHLQSEKDSQFKLVYVIKGSIIDVVIDLRKDSPTYKNYFKIELVERNNALLIPRGFAHGYLSTNENTIVGYKVDNYYNKESEKGIRFNDKFFDIDWGYDETKFILSEKDLNYPDFNE